MPSPNSSTASTSTEPKSLRIDVDPYDVGLLPRSSGIPRQKPFAAIVGCADARVPIELIFSEGPNDLFVVRVAGNGLGDDVMGSLSYAADRLKDSLRTILILGHSQCGAVSAAVDVHLEPAKYLQLMTNKDLRAIVDRTLVVIELGATWLERVHGTKVVRRPGYRAALIEVAIVLNAALTAHGVRSMSGLGYKVDLMSSTESIFWKSILCGRQHPRIRTGSTWRLRRATRMNSSSCATSWCRALGCEPCSMAPRCSIPGFEGASGSPVG